MSLEQIEKMVRAANPVPDVAVLSGRVSLQERLNRQETATMDIVIVEVPSPDGVPNAPTDQLGRTGTLHSLNGAHFADADVFDTRPTSAVDPAGDRHHFGRWMLVAAAVIVVLSLGLAALAVREQDSVQTDPFTTTIDTAPTISGGMWPQSSMDEVREAQRLADAGDPAYTWQVNAELAAQQTPTTEVEFFARFLREELSWEEFYWVGFDFRSGLSLSEGAYDHVVFVRCATAQTNPLYPDQPCAPTIDELRYETVDISAAQLDRRDAGGVWVITKWEMIEPAEQVAPPTDAESTEFLEAFLGARVAGEAAGRYIDRANTFPLLYATTTGEPFERFEIVTLGEPAWPGGERDATVRLFAGGGATVVEQRLTLSRNGIGGLVTQYDDLIDANGGTSENGRAVTVPVDYSFLDGRVTFVAAPPWREELFSPYFSENLTTLSDFAGGYLAVAANLRPVGPDCQAGPIPADAAALAQAIASDADLQVTEPVATRVAGTDALVMDIVAAEGAIVCDWWEVPLVLRDVPENAGDVADAELPRGVPLGSETRMRLYLLDMPGGSAGVLAIAVFAPEDAFEQVLESTAPIVVSSPSASSFHWAPRCGIGSRATPEFGRATIGG